MSFEQMSFEQILEKAKARSLASSNGYGFFTYDKIIIRCEFINRSSNGKKAHCRFVFWKLFEHGNTKIISKSEAKALTS